MKKILMLFVIVGIMISVVMPPLFTGFTANELQIPVLMYHDFRYDRQDSVTVHPDDFNEQLEALSRAGFTTITNQDLINFKNGDRSVLPTKPILLTIDDGYLSNYELAFPLMKKHNMKATIFVIVERRDQGHKNHFSWEQTREMVESGLISIQTHTYNHHDYIERSRGFDTGPILITFKKGESREEYYDRIYDDLSLANSRINKEIGTDVIAFAAPYGVFNKQAIDISKTLGIELFYRVKPKMNTSRDLKKGILHRFNVSEGMTGQELVDIIDQN